MTEDLQQLLDRIRSEGVEKAQAEAKSITDAAKAEAAGIIEKAKAEAAATRAAAQTDADSYAVRAEQQVRQAMRDIHLQVAQDLENLVNSLLLKDVAAAMAKPENISSWISRALDAYLANGEKEIEVQLGGRVAELAETLRGELRAKAAADGVAVSASTAFPEGFTIRMSGGRVEECFTADAVASALSAMLRPEIAKLLRAQ